MNASHPRWAARMLGFLLPFDRFRSTLSDVDEVYEAIAESEGRRRANLWYLGQVSRALLPGIVNTISWGAYMIAHYARAAFRTMKRNKLTSSVNLAGLSIAIGASIVMFMFVDLQLNMDRFHENADNVYLVEYELSVGGDIQRWANSPAPLGPAVLRSIPEVRNAARVAVSSAAVRYGDLVLHEPIRLVDPAFLDVFSFPLIAGSTAGLAEPDGLIITQTEAKKYFGAANPVGETMTLKFPGRPASPFVVSGVAMDLPVTASFGFGFLASYQEPTANRGVTADWSEWVGATFLLLDSSANAEAMELRLQDFVPAMQAASPDRSIKRIMAVPLLDVPTQSITARESMLARLHPVTAWLFLTMALLVLAVASFNYVNIAIVGSMGRAKEIGVRKVVGSYRWQLILQFLGEHLVVSAMALGVGTLLAGLIFIPWLNGLLGMSGNGFALNYADNKLLWLFLAGVLGLTGVGAGLYPAFLISNFEPSRVLRGGVTVGAKKRLSKVLMGCQFVFSFLLLALSIAIVENASSERERDWGYNQAQTIVVPFTDAQTLRAFDQEAGQHSGILRSSGSAEHISGDGQNASVSRNGSPYEVRSFSVGFDYLQTMKLRLAEGRFFDRDQQTDRQESVIVNQQFLDELKLDSGLGAALRMGSEQLTIVGVVEDFAHMPFIMGIDPILFRVVDEDEYRFLAMDIAPGLSTDVFDHLKTVWAGQNPDIPFEGFFQDAVFDSYFTSMSGSSGIFVFISGIALVISVMGLLGFVLITVSRRAREIGIRKVVGATVWDVLRGMQMDMLGVVLLAVGIGSVLSYLIVTRLLNAMLPAGLDIGGAFILLPAAVILSVAYITSMSAGYRGALVNPIETLRAGSE